MTLRGVLVVICGPSGVGKGTVVRNLLERVATASLSISVTTRPPRSGEVDGVHYWFVDDAAFDRLVAEGALLEWATYAGHRYGTPRDRVEQELAAGRDVILEIDVQGAIQVTERVAEALTIFLVPPSFAELERRLDGRGTEDDHARAVRLETARRELDQRDRFDHVVLNDDVDACTRQILELIDKARPRG